MTDIYKWSRTAADNDDADSGINWAEGQSAASVNDSARQMMARVAELLDDVGATQTTGGTANAHTLTARSSFTAYETGLIIGFKAGATNTGATTLNVNGIGAKAVRKITSSGESALGAGDITANGLFLVVYDAAANSGAGAWILLNVATLVSLNTANTFSADQTVAHDDGARVIVSGAAETLRGFTLQTAGSSRWRLAADSTAESGSSAGSDLQMHRWNDAGFVPTAVLKLVRANGATHFVTMSTTASAANAFLDSSDENRLLRSTSSLDFKRNVEPVDKARADAALQAPGIWYRSAAPADNPDWSWYGFAAEEIAAVDPRLVHWGFRDEDYDETPVTNDDGEVVEVKRTLKANAKLRPDGVMYDRFVVIHQEILRDLVKRVEALENK